MKTILLRDGFEAYVDDEDYHAICTIDWLLMKHKRNGVTFYYAYRNFLDSKNKSVRYYLHHLILRKPKSDEAFWFKDGNRLNCQKENLEIISRSKKNHNNFRKNIGHNAPYRGVQIYYVAKIRVNYKLITIGCFENERDAAKAYNKKALELFGKNASLNKL
ncbi:hypothetical protein [Lacihabitans lacunae]|uniref:Pathogenesis-related transcriptional factor and ERF protein n=1 Tax=Lacihabitans lacunae TaxID=1028214 RepID=A0ABV7Z164_9BACT